MKWLHSKQQETKTYNKGWKNNINLIICKGATNRNFSVYVHKSKDLRKEKKLDETRVSNAVNSVNTYMNVFSSVTGQISNILQTQMDNYDENSEQYKQLQIANSWINTLSGSLSAFMSGIQSGIPWPGNLILAGVLGASTFATGAAQINNMKSNNYSNALTSSASNVGSEYETTVYQQQVDTLSSVKDSKVYVLENEISNVQRKVEVREHSVTY